MSHTSIREWSPDDRPREKLLARGEDSLATSELLAILLRTGTKGVSAIDLARHILARFGTLRNMAHTDARVWREFKGMGRAKTAQIKAALELGRRLREEGESETRPLIRTAKDAADLLVPYLRDRKKEVFRVIFLNSQNRVIAVEDMALGTVNHASPIIREIFQRALEHFAVSIIGAHNHPSGNESPSAEDRAFTRKLTDAGEVLGIKVLDHIIIAAERYYSFTDNR